MINFSYCFSQCNVQCEVCNVILELDFVLRFDMDLVG